MTAEVFAEAARRFGVREAQSCSVIVDLQKLVIPTDRALADVISPSEPTAQQNLILRPRSGG